jgi:hypothetical protein
MTEWSDEKYAALVACSQALHNNKHLLPVAVWLAEHEPKTVQAAEVERGLGGRSTSNRVIQALERLCEAGFMAELPYPGRPHPRIFELRSGAFWHFARVLPIELNVSSSTDSKA